MGAVTEGMAGHSGKAWQGTVGGTSGPEGLEDVGECSVEGAQAPQLWNLVDGSS